MRSVIHRSPVTAAALLGGLCLAALAGCSQADSSAPATEAASSEATLAATAAPTCITLQRGVSGTVTDALLNAGQPDKTYGTTGSLTAGVTSGVLRQSLLGFDLSAIPAGSTVVSSTLTLYQLLPSGAPGPVRLHRVLSPWSEATVTWNSFAAGYAAQVETQIPPVTQFTAVTADLSSLVQRWVSGAAPNLGVLLERDPDGSTVYASSEGIQAQRPSLAVCYVPPFCFGKADGTACDDGNACTTGDACQAGQCAGTAVTCAAPDQCHAGGSCDTTTGLCSAPALADGTACDDGNAATVGDHCQAGVCAGVDHCAGVTCPAPDACHLAGVCDHATGACSYANQADGTACDDGDANTVNDVCTGGLCAGQNLCLGVTCPAPADACHLQGSCDHSTGLCSNPLAPNGTACDDGNPSTAGDVCTAGACAGVDHCIGVVCTPSDACHTAGTCDHSTGVCGAGPAKADGTACDDGNATTSGDRCLAGACTPTATCADGVQDQGETGVDCGGPCAACAVNMFLGGWAEGDPTSIALACPAGTKPFEVKSQADATLLKQYAAAQSANGSYYWANFFASGTQAGWMAAGNVWTDSNITESNLSPLNLTGNTNGNSQVDPIPLRDTQGFVNRGCGSNCLWNSTEGSETGKVVCDGTPAASNLFVGGTVQNGYASIVAGCPAGSRAFVVHTAADAAKLLAFVRTQSLNGSFYYANFFANATQAGWARGPSTFIDAAIVESTLAPASIAGNGNGNNQVDPIPVQDNLGFVTRSGGNYLYNATETVQTGKVVCEPVPATPAYVIGSLVQNSWASISTGCPAGKAPVAVKSEADAEALRTFLLQAGASGTYYFANFFANGTQAGWATGAGASSWIDANVAESTLMPMDITGNANGNSQTDAIPLQGQTGFVNRGCATCLYNATESVQTGYVICQ